MDQWGRPSKSERSSLSKKFKDNQFKGRNWLRCGYCGLRINRENATADHMIPISAGGRNRQKNMILACIVCNKRKGSMDREQFIDLLRKEGAYRVKKRSR